MKIMSILSNIAYATHNQKDGQSLFQSIMHHILHEFSVLVIFSVVSCQYKNFDILDKKSSESCLVQILKRLDGSEKLFRVVLEKNSSNTSTGQLQNEVLTILANTLMWFVEIIEGGEEQSEFSLKVGGVPVVQRVLLLLGVLETFQDKVDLLLLDKHVSNGFKLVVLLLTETDQNYEEIAKDLLLLAQERKLFGTIIITQTNVSNEWYVYSERYTKRTKYCMDNIVPHNSLRCFNDNVTFISKSWNFKYEFPCTVDVVTHEYSPFVSNETSGFEIELLQTLGKYININFNMLIEDNNESNWGELNKTDGTWSGRLGEVLDRSAIAIGNLRATPKLHPYFEFSDAYYYDRMVWVVPVAELAPRWMCIFMPFSYQLWLFLIAIFNAGGFLLWFSYVRKESRAYSTLNRALFASFQIFLGGGTKRSPLTKVTRAVFISITFCGMFVCSVYQGSLIDVLTHPIYQHQITSLEEAIQSGLKIGGFQQYKDYFNDSNDMKIYNMFEIKTNSNVCEWLERVAKERDTVTLAGELHVRYLMASGDEVVVTNDLPKIYILKNAILPLTTSILMPRGFPLKNRIDRGIANLITNGITSRLTKSAIKTLEKYESKKRAIFEGKQVLSLTLDNLQGAFVLLLLGYSFASITFLLELIIRRVGLDRKCGKTKRKFKRETIKWFIGKRR